MVIVIAIIIVAILLALYFWKDHYIILPEERQVPVIEALQSSHWKDPYGDVHFLQFMTGTRLLWYGIDKLGGPVEMNYVVMNPYAIYTGPPNLSDYDMNPNYVSLELVDSDKVLVQTWRGHRMISPPFLFEKTGVRLLG